MKRCLLLSYTFPPDNTPAAVRPGQLFRYLPQFGYQPVVVAGPSTQWESGKGFIYRVPDATATAAARLASRVATRFERYAVPYNDRIPWIPHAVAAARPLIQNKEVSAIFSTSPFLTAHMAALWLHGQSGLPWIADFQDPVADNPDRQRRWPYPYNSLLERSVFSHAFHVTANTDTVAALWASRYPQWQHKMSILWNAFDPAEEMPVVQPAARPHRLLTHVGSFYVERRPRQLLAALLRLVDAGRLSPSCLRVKLVGSLDSRADEKPLLDRLTQLGMLEYDNLRVPREVALEETAAADYLLVIDQPSTPLQLPSKVIDYIRIGKPVLAFTLPDSPVERVLGRSGMAYVAISPAASESETCGKIEEFLRLPPGARMAEPWFGEQFNCVNQAARLAGLFDRAGVK